MDVRGELDFHKGKCTIHCLEVRYYINGNHEEDIYLIKSYPWGEFDIHSLTMEYDLPDYANCRVEVWECSSGFVSLTDADKNDISGNNLLGL